MVARIAMISEHASPLATLGGVDSGGQNVYVAQLANQLAARGYQVDVFTRRDQETLPDVVKFISRVRVVHVKAGPPVPIPKEQLLPYMPEFARQMSLYCRRQRMPYDVVHANFWTSGVVAMALKAELDLPFVITFHALGRVRRLHQGEADHFPDERPEIEERIIAAADCVIAECAQDRADLLNLYGADPARIRIVPCGFDSAELWPVEKCVARRVLGFAPGERIVASIGRLVPRKGIDVAIRALGRLWREHGVDARLVVVGGESELPCPTATPEIARLHRIAAEEGVDDRVTFTGSCRRQLLRYYYSAADVFVTTPWYEPFGITPVEAMACGTPVIGTSVGGIKTTIRHGRTGFLIPPHSADALAARLAELLGAPELRRALGDAGRERANRHFTWAQVADRVASLYAHVIAAGAEQRAGNANA
ncbi:glycosyl transferase family 1 [Sulfurifustis variabilis]|uniref:Glycosyl transferase family 1 n=1 Tax=Sulfurifustis variabilis TaxID=1675686 RepID=A0A1B4VBR9_9GAMM|nr:glycosyltransferase [Sulfurifustis variabilis]BAU48281.1 glycosyl transferase family 1 [Sulfurifustis variabilis]